MLAQAAAASCWVLESSTAVAVELSLSARRNSERASRSSAVTAFADAGPGLSLSAMPLSLPARRPERDQLRWEADRDLQFESVVEALLAVTAEVLVERSFPLDLAIEVFVLPVPVGDLARVHQVGAAFQEPADTLG